MSEAIPSQAPAAEPQDNPFATVAQLLRSLRESLEGTKRPGQAPRWVRIARIRAYRSDTDSVSYTHLQSKVCNHWLSASSPNVRISVPSAVASGWM